MPNSPLFSNAASKTSKRAKHWTGLVGCLHNSSSVKLLLIDGHYYVYRSFFAIRELANSKGDPTNAIYGFIKTVRRMVKDLAPDYGAVIWDEGIPQRRVQLQPAYKQQRADPAEMRAHFDFTTNLNLKVIDHIDGRPAIRQLTSRKLANIVVHECWKGPCTVELRPNAQAPVYRLPVLEALTGFYWRADFTLVPGQIIHDYLAEP